MLRHIEALKVKDCLLHCNPLHAEKALFPGDGKSGWAESRAKGRKTKLLFEKMSLK